MPQVVVLFLAACGTALATGLGAIPVFFLGRRAAQLTPPLLGFAAGVMGVAAVAGLSLFVILAIAIQNIPEGTSVAIPMAEAGFGRARMIWAAVGTSAPQPVGAVIAFAAVETVGGLLAFSFSFAAGAMVGLVAVEMLPRAFSGPTRTGPVAGVAAGAALMLALTTALGV
jgi:ZIP family zinc transporter